MGVKRDNGNNPAGQGGIVWTNEKRRLGDLIPWPRNPRQIKKAEAARLAESLDDFGQVDVFALGPDNQLYNGHQRLAVWSLEHGPDYEVDVRVSSRPLSEKERERLTVLLHRGAAGSWDFDLLANEFDADELIAWGFEAYELGLGATADEWGNAFDKLPDEDRAPFQQMTFTLHDEQAEQVKAAITAAKTLGPFVDSPNENSNGNALARIAETFLTEHGQG